MYRRALAATAVTAALVFTGSTAFAASTSTKLSNGRLYFEALHGSVVDGNPTKWYGTTQYEKTGGNSVNITLEMYTSNGLYRDSTKSISKGQKKGKTWVVARSSDPSCSAKGIMVADTGTYETPTVHFC